MAKIKKGIVLFALILATDAVACAVSVSLTFAFLYRQSYISMFILLGLSMLFAYAIPFFLAALLWRFNAKKVSAMAIRLDTTDAELIADGLEWRLKPTQRLVKKCIKRKYI